MIIWFCSNWIRTLDHFSVRHFPEFFTHCCSYYHVRISSSSLLRNLAVSLYDWHLSCLCFRLILSTESCFILILKTVSLFSTLMRSIPQPLCNNTLTANTLLLLFWAFLSMWITLKSVNSSYLQMKDTVNNLQHRLHTVLFSLWCFM